MLGSSISNHFFFSAADQIAKTMMRLAKRMIIASYMEADLDR
jgi:hypothetical protein